MTTFAHTTLELDALRGAITGTVVGSADAGWDDARQAWNLAVDQRPAAVVLPEDADDVVEAVRFARASGLRVAAQGTGHNAAPLGDLSGTLLVRTSRMTGVQVDPAGRRARVQAGTLWLEVMEAAQAHGLTALGGSSPDVGVVGYSLGGGIGWLARRYGMSTNSILAVELVTADGELVRADAFQETDLFWALRGGGGNFGVVTAIEIRLYPHATVVGGAMAWDWSHSQRVLRRWAEWAPGAPDEITTSARIMQLPPLPDIPEPIRGRQLVMIDGAFSGDPADADAVLAPLRELGPEIDTFATIPAAGLVRIHGDPEGAVPVAPSRQGMLDVLPPEAIDAFVGAVGPGSGSTLLMGELRQLGGALGRVPAQHGALPTLDAQFALFGAGMAMDEQMARAGDADAQRLADAMAPWLNGRSYLNFAEQAIDTGSAYRAENWDRLQAIRAQVDPTGLFHANHQVH